MKYFEKYGEIIDSVIMKDRHTGRPRGFGFITYADPSVVDTVITETHIINDKQVSGLDLLSMLRISQRFAFGVTYNSVFDYYQIGVKKGTT